MDNFMLAVVVLLIGIFISRMINENAMKKLQQDKKAALVDMFSQDRIWTYGVLIAILMLYFSSLKFQLIDPFWTYLIYIIFLTAYIVIMAYSSFKKLKANDFPNFYIKSYILSTSLRLLSLLVFVALLGF